MASLRHASSLEKATKAAPGMGEVGHLVVQVKPYKYYELTGDSPAAAPTQRHRGKWLDGTDKNKKASISAGLIAGFAP
jgi:hypothetical protein